METRVASRSKGTLKTTFVNSFKWTLSKETLISSEMTVRTQTFNIN